MKINDQDACCVCLNVTKNMIVCNAGEYDCDERKKDTMVIMQSRAVKLNEQLCRTRQHQQSTMGHQMTHDTMI